MRDEKALPPTQSDIYRALVTNEVAVAERAITQVLRDLRLLGWWCNHGCGNMTEEVAARKVALRLARN